MSIYSSEIDADFDILATKRFWLISLLIYSSDRGADLNTLETDVLHLLSSSIYSSETEAGFDVFGSRQITAALFVSLFIRHRY